MAITPSLLIAAEPIGEPPYAPPICFYCYREELRVYFSRHGPARILAPLTKSALLYKQDMVRRCWDCSECGGRMD